MILKVNKDICEIKQNEVWNVGDYNVHTVQVELSPEFNGLVNKVRYFVEENSYDMLITDNIAEVPREATLAEGIIKIGVYGYDADTNILVQSTSPVNKYISSGTYTGEAYNTQPLTPTDKQQMESAIQKNADDIINLQNNKQNVLISGENIKTINNESVLGEGNIEIDLGPINYNDIQNKPMINNVELYGNMSLSELGIQPSGNYATMNDLTEESRAIFNEIETTYYNKNQTNNLLNTKQNTLISGQNIKTINNESLLGEGNIIIQGGGTSDYTDLTNKPKINNIELNGNKSLNDLGIQPSGNYALESEMIEAQNDIDHLSKVSNLFEKITGTGTSVTLNDTSNTIMKLNLDTTTSSQATTTGKNLLPSTLTSQTINNVTVTRNSDGSITLNGTTNAKTDFKWFEGEIQLEAGTYYIGLISTSDNFNLYSIGSNGTNVLQNPASNQYTTLTLGSNTTYTRLSSYASSGKTFNNETFYPIICKELPVEYEIYTGGQPAPNPSYPQPVHTISGGNAITISNSDNTKSQEYPINLGDIEICKIGDYQDVLFKNTMDSENYNSSLELNKWYKLNNIGKVVLDGSENWATTSYSRFYCDSLFAGIKSENGSISNYFVRGNTETTNNVFGISPTGRIYIRNDEQTTLSNFKTWLSTHNLIVYYVLATPTYTLLNDTLQTQLDNIQYALAYDTQTNISQTNNDLPFIINAETYAKIGGGGTSDYTNLTNKPKINNVELNGNKSLNDLGIQPKGNYIEDNNYVHTDNNFNNTYKNKLEGLENYDDTEIKADISDIQDEQVEQNTDIENLQEENARLKATLPTTTGEGQDITLDKTAEMEFVKPPLPRGNTKQDTTTGKNLLNSINANTTTVNGVTSYRSNGVYYLSGTNTKTDAKWILPNTQNTNLPTFEIGQTYTMSFKGTMPNGIYAQLNGVQTSTGTQYSIGSVRNTIPSVTFTIDSDYSSTAQLFVGIQGATTNADCNFAIQIEKGSTATSYEPYTGGQPSPSPDYPQEIRNVTGNVEVTISNNDNSESKTLPVSLGNIELCKIGNYQDYLYKNNGKWYKYNAINKLVLNGSENWAISNNVFYLASISDYVNSSGKICLSDKYTAIKNTEVGTLAITQNNSICFFINNTNPRLYIRDERFNNVNAFKAELSENNVKVYYPTATPTDTEITDTTLISQLEEISKTLSYQGQTNITSNTIALFNVEAYQSTKLILKNLDSRLTLVEG